MNATTKWLSLLCCIWWITSCVHRVPITPQPVQEVVDTLQLPSRRHPVCRFQVLSDSTLALAPIADVRDRHYCVAAFERWARQRQPQVGPPR